MKKIAFTAWLSVCLAMQIFSQDYGIQWVQGPGPMSSMDFRNDTITFLALNDTACAFVGVANICDTYGDLLFFTNGIYVRDRYGSMMENGDSLGYDPVKHSAFNSVYNSVYTCGSPNHQGVMILPRPGSNHLYYIFHFMPIDTEFISNGGFYAEPTRFYYTVVDMNANFGLGSVVEKNKRLPLGLQCASRMTACKHANGRDWWVIRHGFRDSTYFKFLFTPDSIIGPYTQKIGSPHQVGGNAFDYYGASVFNQEGDRFATANQLGPVVIMDFDRCSGEFSNPIAIQNLVPDTNVSGAMGLAFSPNGRFLYASNKVALNQYDLLSSNINDSVRLFTETNDTGFAIRFVQLAPNSKIYISTWHGGSYALHVINEPDELGLACGFEFNGQQCMSGNTLNLPNMPNYKLGALHGSICDTIVSSTETLTDNQGGFLLYPNPMSNMVNIQTDVKGHWKLSNAIGKIVMEQNIEQGNTIITTGNLAAGVYYYRFTTTNKLQQHGKLVKQ